MRKVSEELKTVRERIRAKQALKPGSPELQSLMTKISDPEHLREKLTEVSDLHKTPPDSNKNRPS